ncbi:MAG TPA: ring-cleaving dioxygenase [Candidatus Acidoferrum sp.]|nr:ring-cleaving dioxygenase [Candidatus Acidoferrum sp.]
MPIARGLHHMTVCVGGAQEDIDFQTRIFGQRMIKQTVLFDGRYAHYHLYYANANAEPGSVYTTFPYGRVRGRQGSGQIQSTAYSVPKGSLKFWLEHLSRHHVNNSGIQERFGQKFIRFDHPSGIQLEVVEDSSDTRKPWSVGEVSSDVATRGFHGPVLSVREIAETERFFVDALGFKKTGQEGPYHRFELGEGGPNKTVTLLHEPERPSGSWIFGAGTAHHMALDVESDEKLAEQKALYEELGYTDASEIKDRMYFHSVYCRCPGGILVECAATVPQGFAVDEPADQLGQSLLLPPWFEQRRAEIEAMLEPIKVPESNFPGGVKKPAVKVPVSVPAAAAEQAPGGPSRRTSAVFIGGDKPASK